jgi:integrase
MSKKRCYGFGSLYRKRRKNPATKKSEEYGNYRIKYKNAAGKTEYHKLNTADKNEAEILYAEWIATRARGEDTILGGDMTVKEYFQAHLAKREDEQKRRNNIRASTIDRYRNIFAKFLAYLDERGLAYATMKSFKTEHLAGYLDYRIEQTRFNGQSDVKLTKSGTNGEYRLIRGVFRKAFNKRVIPIDITEEVVPFTIEVKQKKLPTKDDIEEVLTLIVEEAVRDFVRVAMLTGARSAELTHLKWENADFGKGTISILPEMEGGWKAKNKGSYRSFATPVEVERIFKSHRRRRLHETPDSYIFVMPDGRPFNAYPNYAYRRLTKAVRKANKLRKKRGAESMPEFTVHTLRHWFICWALTREENPLTEIELTQIVGHADINMIRDVYFHGDIQWATSRRMRETTLFGDALEGRA